MKFGIMKKSLKHKKEAKSMKYNKKKHPIVFLVAALLACQPISA